MEKYVIFTTRGYFVGDLNCKAEFLEILKKLKSLMMSLMLEKNLDFYIEYWD